MTTVFHSGNQGNADSPGTHVFIVGVGEYPCLLGGDPERLLDKPMGLGQLSSPPLSAVALADWFVGRQAPSKSGVEQLGFHNPHAPLASVEMLVSPGLSYHCPDGTTAVVDAATRVNIAKGYRTWRARAKSNPGSIAVFYFCGHGAAGSNDYILPSDFGEHNPDNPWADAIDITETARAARREVSGSLYFFIDACRQPSRDSMMPGAGTPALQPFIDGRVVCFTRMLLWATGEGAPAFGAKGQVSRFTAALVEALSGDYGEKMPEDTNSWVVTGDGLAWAVRTILETENSSLDDSMRQHIEQQLIGSQVFHYETRAPKIIRRLVSTWSANPSVREIARDIGETLAEGVREALAEQLEQKNVEVDELRREIKEWTRRYEELGQRLADEPDSELVQHARSYLAAGKLEEATALLGELIRAAEARIDAERVRVASYYLSRAEAYLLQFKPVEALPDYRKAYELFPDDPKYAVPYAFALQQQNNHQRAEAIYTSILLVLKKSAEAAPEHLRQLAATLNNLGNLYRATQRLNKAETAFQEALDVQRKLAEADPGACQSDVATTLNNLGVHYWGTRRLTEADTAYQKALSIYRKLAEANPLAHLPDVAMALNNLGVFYRDTQQLTEAETAYQEALDIRRALAETNPAAYLPDVALTLNNLGILYRNAQRPDEAAAAYQDALGTYRTLVEVNPAAYLPAIATILHNLGTLFQNTQRLTKAETVYEEALDIRRRLAEANPPAYLPDVAMTLNNLGNLYNNTQRPSKAGPTYQEALGIYRKLAEANPSPYLPEVATILNNLGLLYARINRPTEAGSAYQEALRIYRDEAAALPPSYLPDVAMTFKNQANLYRDTMRPDEAEAAYQKALGIYRKLAEANPAVFLPDVAMTLNSLGCLYAPIDRLAEAESANLEALGVYRELADANPSAYLADVATTLDNLAILYQRTQRRAQAESANHEACVIRQKLAETNPDG